MTGGNQRMMVTNPSKKSLQQEQQALKKDVLNDVPTERYPERIDWLAKYIALNEARDMLHQPSGKQIHLTYHTVDTLGANVATDRLRRRKRGIKRE